MSETTDLIHDMAEKLFGDMCDKNLLDEAEKGVWPKALWSAMEEAGLTRALTDENAGGSGLSIGDAMVATRVAARHAAPAPIAETMLAEWLAASAGLSCPAGPLTVAPVLRTDKLSMAREGNGWRLKGVAHRTPYAANAAAIFVLVEAEGKNFVARVGTSMTRIAPGHNVAREPRETVSFDCALASDDVAPTEIDAARLRAFGAAMRTVQIAGALSRALDLSLQYVQERVQFGKPISKFQAIQHNMAMLAAHSAAANAAADIASEAAETDLDPIKIGVAKTRAGEAASVGAALAHAAHGAIGFTHDHTLHFSTKRLWSWRDEFGKESEWSALVGRAGLNAGGAGVWRKIIAQ